MTKAEPSPRASRFRRGPGTLYRKLTSLRFLLTRDRKAVGRFLKKSYPNVPFSERLAMVWAYVHTTNHVRAYHTQEEMLAVAEAILERSGKRRPLTVVEAGAGKGASTAKLSLALSRAGGGELHVFDSFRGLPANTEEHQNLDGRRVRFKEGAFTGRLASVQRTVARYGVPECVVYHRGWFQDTMPHFKSRVDVALFDVDLLASTECCLRYIFPLLEPDGVAFCQDGHLRAIVERLRNESFWRNVVGVVPPEIDGLGERKFIFIPASMPAKTI